MNIHNLHTQQQLKKVDFSTKNIERTVLRDHSIIPTWRENRGYILKYHHKKKSDTNKCILYVHGGGFTANQPRDDTYDTLCSILVHLTHFDVYCPDYTLAPDAVYPTQIKQVLALAEKLSKQYSKIIIGSDSAGGCIAMSSMFIAPTLFYNSFFMSPWLNLKNDSSSYLSREWCETKRTGDPIFKGSYKDVKKYSDTIALEYLKYKKYLDDPIANPSLASNNMLQKLPPVLIICGDKEVIRNDSVDFVAKAQEVNDNIHFSLYDDMWHDWPLYYQTASGDSGQQAYYQIAGFCKGLRHGKSFKYTYKKLIHKVNATVFL